MNFIKFSATSATRVAAGSVEHKATQTAVARDIHDQNQDKQSTKLLQTHALLVRFVSALKTQTCAMKLCKIKAMSIIFYFSLNGQHVVYISFLLQLLNLFNLPNKAIPKNCLPTILLNCTALTDLSGLLFFFRKYEKELATNTENSETISNLKISNSKLESELRSTREKHHKTSVALEKYKQQTEKKLQNDKEEIFKLTAERDSIRYEHERLKSEMRGIDKNFFDEIEDLKYALQESAKLNKIYEKTLQSVCRKSKVDYQEALLKVVSKCRKSEHGKSS